MTIRPVTADTRHWRRGLAAATVAVVLLSVVGYVVTASSALVRVNANRSIASVATWRANPVSVAPMLELSEAVVKEAVTARPLDPRALNIAAVRAVARTGEAQLPRWISVLSRMGWRDTSTLLNRLYLATRQADIPQVLNLADGLMRRRQLQEQIIPVLSLVETDPVMRRNLVRRLAGNPGWRDIYLYSTGHLRNETQLEARFQLLRELAQRGLRPGQNEIASNVRAMVIGGRPELGFALWSGSQSSVVRPLNDPRFVRAGTAQETAEEVVPFEWQITNGSGFDVGAYVQDGHSALEIQWDGRGVPVFARQHTSASPGRQQLDVDVASENVADLSGIRFLLICGNKGYVFEQQPEHLKRFITNEAIPCPFPILEIAGDIQSRAAPRRIELRGLRLTRISRF